MNVLAVYDVEFMVMAMIFIGTILFVYGLYRVGKILVELIRYKVAPDWKKDLIIGLICLLFGTLFSMAYVG